MDPNRVVTGKRPELARSGRAAQYVRMSTDHQKYSIDNQADVIAVYAAAHHLTIVQTYADAGRSGLRLEGRDALQHLLDDVQSGLADFEKCTCI
jgi:DNA invertase Pin-like site-specific DNA recombinase